MSAFIFLILGFFSLLEFFLPGAIMGGGGWDFYSCKSYLICYANAIFIATALFIVGISIGLVYLVKFTIWRIRTAKPQRSIYSNASQDGYQAVSYDASAVGKEGVVLTDLKPGGFIIVDGKQQPAISKEGYLSKGTKVKVIGGEESNLIVRKE